MLLASLRCHPAPKDATPAPASTDPLPPAVAPSSTTAPTPAADAEKHAIPPAQSPLPAAPFTAERLHEFPVTSIAVGKLPKLATFGSEALLFDKSGWRRRPLPKTDADAVVARAEIYYGRDNQPRLMGAWKRGEVLAPLYLRHKAAGFTEEPSEIASLAASKGQLYGVLGYEDPEVVCATDSVCLVKSVQGWKRMPANAQPERLFMTSEGVHVVRGAQLFVLDLVTWRAVASLDVAGQPLGDVSDLCFETPSRIWLLAAGVAYLRDAAVGSTFSEQTKAPTAGRALVCERPGSVWVAGVRGAAHFDGTSWSVVATDTGELAAAEKGHDSVLVGGPRGLYALRPSP